MPSPRSQTRNRRGWTDEHIDALIGWDWFRVFLPHNGSEADELAAQREAWAELGDGLTFEFAKNHPFHRPHSWWTFSAPERRRCVNRIHPHDVPEHIAHVAKAERENPGFKAWHDRLSHGVPNLIGGPGFCLEPMPLYESEQAYLVRLDLLFPFERELLATESPPATN